MFIVSTYTDGQPPTGVSWFYQWLGDTVADFRVQKSMLSGIQYAVFGLGNSEYGDNFNKVCTCTYLKVKTISKYFHWL